MRGCSSVECDRFALYNIFWRRQQACTKMSSYFETYEYVEVYADVWSVLVCSGEGCDRVCSYKIILSILQYGMKWIALTERLS